MELSTLIQKTNLDNVLQVPVDIREGFYGFTAHACLMHLKDLMLFNPRIFCGMKFLEKFVQHRSGVFDQLVALIFVSKKKRAMDDKDTGYL